MMHVCVCVLSRRLKGVLNKLYHSLFNSAKSFRAENSGYRTGRPARFSLTLPYSREMK